MRAGDPIGRDAAEKEEKEGGRKKLLPIVRGDTSDGYRRSVKKALHALRTYYSTWKLVSYINARSVRVYSACVYTKERYPKVLKSFY